MSRSVIYECYAASVPPTPEIVSASKGAFGLHTFLMTLDDISKRQPIENFFFCAVLMSGIGTGAMLAAISLVNHVRG